jgi:hypothetical protein
VLHCLSVAFSVHFRPHTDLFISYSLYCTYTHNHTICFRLIDSLISWRECTRPRKAVSNITYKRITFKYEPPLALMQIATGGYRTHEWLCSRRTCGSCSMKTYSGKRTCTPEDCQLGRNTQLACIYIGLKTEFICLVFKNNKLICHLQQLCTWTRTGTRTCIHLRITGTWNSSPLLLSFASISLKRNFELELTLELNRPGPTRTK